MKISGIIVLAIAALIVFLFPFIEVEYVEKEPVTETEVYYETEAYHVQHYNPTEVVTKYRTVKKLREVVISEGVIGTRKVSILEQLWIHIHPPPFRPILTTGFSNKTTSPFNINTKEWVINWSYVPESKHPERAFFGFSVYPAGETTHYVESAVLPEETTGSIHSHAGSGEYYLEVEASNVEYWRILIRPV